MKFLNGLKDGYEHMRTNFQGMDPFIVVNKSYNLVMQVKRIVVEVSLGA